MKIIQRIQTAAVAVTLCAAAAQVFAAEGTNSVPEKKASAAQDKLNELFADEIVAKGDGFEVKRSELDSVVVNAKSAIQSRGQPVPPQYINAFEQQMLARIIQVKVLLKRAADPDRVAGKDRAEKRLEGLAKRGASEEMINLQIKGMGLTRDEFFTRIVDEATAEIVAERELNVTISDDEAKTYYKEHPSQFEEPERVRASHILFLTVDPTTRRSLTDDQKVEKKKKMEELLKRVRAGEDFAKLATDNTEDLQSKERGGEYVFSRGGQMPPEIEVAAFLMETNQVSDVITTAFGYHILKLSEKLPARQVPYDEVADNLKELLKQQAMVKKLPAYINRLREEAKVEILDPRLEPRDEAADLPEAPNTSGSLSQ